MPEAEKIADEFRQATHLSYEALTSFYEIIRFSNTFSLYLHIENTGCMDILEYREYCLSLPAATECTPFDEDTLVFKVMGKMFTYAGMADFGWFNVKCDPDLAVELRERYEEVLPGFHASKVHWNSVRVDGGLSDAFLREQIRNSYDLVVSKLPRALKEELSTIGAISPAEAGESSEGWRR